MQFNDDENDKDDQSSANIAKGDIQRIQDAVDLTQTEQKQLTELTNSNE